MHWIRIIINILFLIGQIICNNMIQHIETARCKTADDNWQITQIKLIINVMILLNVVNIIIPLNKCMYNIPLIGSSITLIYILLLVTELILLNRIAIYLIDDKCKLGNYKEFIKFMANRTVIGCIGYALLFSIIQLYF